MSLSLSLYQTFSVFEIFHNKKFWKNSNQEICIFYVLHHPPPSPYKTKHTNQKKKIKKTQNKLADSDRANNNSLIAHISNLPGFDASKARFVKQYSTKSSLEKSALEIVPTAAELMLPWRRDRSYQSLGTCAKWNKKKNYKNYKHNTKKQSHHIFFIYLRIFLRIFCN